MDQEFSILAFGSDEFYPPQATVSLAETNLVTPNSPESFYSVKDEEEDKKPTKKRKSWGQELPTPKTNLPPRKRAKTDDEKEQRRIERVLRNRQAAQSSRERKRQEVEKLEGEKSAIEQQNQRLKERLLAVEHEKFQLAQQVAKMAAKLSAFKSKNRRMGSITTSPTPSCAASPSLGAELCQPGIKQELDDYPLALPTPQNSIDQSASSFSSPSSSTYSRSPSPSQGELVSVRGGVASIDSTYDSERSSATPTNDWIPSSLSDTDFSCLFASPASPPPDLHFFTDGLASAEQDNAQDDSDAFSFDQMVDLDACQPQHDAFHDHDNNQSPHQSSHYFASLPGASADFPHQIAATSSALQPCLGASS
ncbi:hypothetical protein MMC22_002877 [Lobaria immixta]|nr:hypothetical protein [Lobaria immixta]